MMFSLGQLTHLCSVQQALYNGGPVGALFAYSIIGSVVYCLCVSIGEMIAFM